MNNTHTCDTMKIVHISSLTSLHSAIFYHVVLMMKSKVRGELTDHFTMEMKHPPYFSIYYSLQLTVKFVAVYFGNIVNDILSIVLAHFHAFFFIMQNVNKGDFYW